MGDTDITLRPGDPDFDAKYLAELRALVARQGRTIEALTAAQERHNATNREAIRQRDDARAQLEKVRADLDTMIAVHDEVERDRDEARHALLSRPSSELLRQVQDERDALRRERDELRKAYDSTDEVRMVARIIERDTAEAIAAWCEAPCPCDEPDCEAKYRALAAAIRRGDWRKEPDHG